MTGNNIARNDPNPYVKPSPSYIIIMLINTHYLLIERSLWTCAYVSCRFIHLWNQYVSPLKLWVRLSPVARYAWYNTMWKTCGMSEIFSGHSVHLHQNIHVSYHSNSRKNMFCTLNIHESGFSHPLFKMNGNLLYEKWDFCLVFTLMDISCFRFPVMIKRNKQKYSLLEISIFLADRCLTFCPFTFVHCVVCPSAIYGFWWPLWYLQTRLIAFYDIKIANVITFQNIKTSWSPPP